MSSPVNLFKYKTVELKTNNNNKKTWFSKMFLTDFNVLCSSRNLFRQPVSLTGTFSGAPSRQCYCEEWALGWCAKCWELWPRSTQRLRSLSCYENIKWKEVSSCPGLCSVSFLGQKNFSLLWMSWPDFTLSISRTRLRWLSILIVLTISDNQVEVGYKHLVSTFFTRWFLQPRYIQKKEILIL